MSAADLNARFSTWLLRPYLDLGPIVIGPLHACALEECWHALMVPGSPPFVPQRSLSPAFRKQLADEAGEAYDVSDPRALPDRFRTERWQTLCEMLDHWHDLPLDHRCRLAALLHSMCLYTPLLSLIPETDITAVCDDLDAVTLAFWRASAHFMQNFPNRVSEYDYAELATFENIASNARDVVPTNFNATAMMFVHKAKIGAPLFELAEWAVRLERALDDAIRSADEFTTELLTSRFYRSMGFLPQRRGDRNEVVRTMDMAEHHAKRVRPASSAQHVLFRENVHAVMESRTKEALWLSDMNLALARSLKVIEVDPYDAKAWIELGEVRYFRKEWSEAVQAYAAAAMLGPPASVVGRYMVAVCLQELGQETLAAFFLKDTIERDPLGISSRAEMRDLSDSVVLCALKEWSRSTAVY